MADENDIQQLAEALIHALSNQAAASNKAAGTTNTLSASIGKLASGANLTEKELQELSRELNISSTNLQALTGGIRGLGPAITGLAGGLARGNTNFDVLNGTVEAAANALGGILSVVPLIGGALNGLSQAAGQTASFMISRFGDAYGSFEKLSQIGAVGATGIGSVVDGFERLNVPLETYTNLVTKNSSALAALSGSTAEGANVITQFAGAMKGIDDPLSGVDRSLRLLGFSSEEISDTMIAYADIQRRIGNTQYLDQEKLTQGTLAYGKELDELARLTGKSREAAQQAQREQMLNARFNAKIREMQASGQETAARQLQKAVTAQQLLGNQQMAQAIMSSATGFFTTPESQAAIVSMNGFNSSVQNLVSGVSDANQFTAQMQEMSKTAVNTFGPLAQAIGDASPVTKMFVEQTNMASIASGKLNQALLKTEETIRQQTESPESRTAALAGARVNLEVASATIQKLVLDQNFVTDLVNVTSEGIKETLLFIKDALRNPSPAPRADEIASPNYDPAETRALLRSQVEQQIQNNNLTQEQVNILREMSNPPATAAPNVSPGYSPTNPEPGSPTVSDLIGIGPGNKGQTTPTNPVTGPSTKLAPSSVVPSAQQQLPAMPAPSLQPQAVPSGTDTGNVDVSQMTMQQVATNQKLDKLTASVDKLSRSLLS